jgi:nuclear transport factor 2 (NTF2) superfamily protein
MSGEEDLLKRVYAGFNSRDIDGVLAALHADVIWANGLEGGHVRGHDGVRCYWTRQWQTIDPHVEPLTSSAGPDGRLAVEVRQTVRDRNGSLLSDKVVGHFFQIEDGLIRRFDIRPT